MSNESCEGCIFLKGSKNNCNGIVMGCLIKILLPTIVSNCPCSVCLLKPICNDRCNARVTFFSDLQDEYDAEFKAEFFRQRTGKHLRRSKQ